MKTLLNLGLCNISKYLDHSEGCCQISDLVLDRIDKVFFPAAGMVLCF